MTTNELSGQERTDLEITVCTNGVVNVHSPESDHAHSVMLDGRGNAVRCSCKGHRFHGHCYHTEEVETRPLVVSSADAANTATTGQQVATDGGTQQVPHTDARDAETTESEDDAETRPQTDHWGNAVEHYDDGPVGAGEKRQCQACGSRFEVALIAATEDSSNQNWEEFYRCEVCGATGSFRFYGEKEPDRRKWTGRIAYPDE